MITQINKESLYNSFGVQTFNCLEGAIDNMAPSLVEYYLTGLCEYSDETYFNKREIEKTIYIGSYSLYIDYNDNVYLEIDNVEDEETQSFW